MAPLTESPTPRADDLHEWISFQDPSSDRTWVFDLTFLMSTWRCIFGQGCPGVLTGPAPEMEQGCCSYGAHFVDEEDRASTDAYAARLTAEQWQFKAKAAKRGGATKTNKAGELVTRLVDGACIFLNRPEFPGGAGCALHRAALDEDERPLDWKPDVCWQLPLRLDEHTDPNGHVTSTLREWKRRDWGPGGEEFHWWCTDDSAAFIDRRLVYQTMKDEIVEMTSPEAYAILLDLIAQRGERQYLPHPALKRRSESAEGGG
jgi:hypothetical protein